MRTKIIVILTLVISVFNFSIVYAQDTNQFTFTGRVVDADGKPVAGATAKLYTEDYNESMLSYEVQDITEATTNADGEFAFIRHINNEDYPYGFITVEKEGLALDCICWEMQDEKETKAKLTLGQPEILTGTVVDENGVAIFGSQVSLLLLRIGSAEEHHLSVSSAPKIMNAITDDKGQFSFTNLPILYFC